MVARELGVMTASSIPNCWKTQRMAGRVVSIRGIETTASHDACRRPCWPEVAAFDFMTACLVLMPSGLERWRNMAQISAVLSMEKISETGVGGRRIFRCGQIASAEMVAFDKILVKNSAADCGFVNNCLLEVAHGFRRAEAACSLEYVGVQGVGTSKALSPMFECCSSRT